MIAGLRGEGGLAMKNNYPRLNGWWLIVKPGLWNVGCIMLRLGLLKLRAVTTTSKLSVTAGRFSEVVKILTYDVNKKQ